MPPRDSATEPYTLMNPSSYFRLRHSRSMKILSRNRHPAVHADPNAVDFQSVDKHRAGELNALVGVEHLRWAIAIHRRLQRCTRRRQNPSMKWPGCPAAPE